MLPFQGHVGGRVSFPSRDREALPLDQRWWREHTACNTELIWYALR